MTASRQGSYVNGKTKSFRCAIFWTCFILAVTLFPYGPLVGPLFSNSLHRFDLNFAGNSLDFLTNILLFVPWAFCMTRALAGGGGYRRRSLVPLWIGLGISGLIELLQTSLPSRDPALSDITANLLGVGAGMWLQVAGGDRLWATWESLATSFYNFLSRRILVCLLIIHALLVIGIIRYSEHQTSFTNWDRSYHLNIGNESTGDRPWRGDLGAVLLWASIKSEQEIERILGGISEKTWTETDPQWSFDPAVSTDVDRNGILSLELAWQPISPTALDQQLTVLSADQWLKSIEPAVQLTDALQQAQKFTLFLVIQTDDTMQAGPARIISLSRDPFLRNFTLGQDGPDLVFRLRTPFTGLNGNSPALVMPNVFAEGEQRRIVVTYDGHELIVSAGEDIPKGHLDLRYGSIFAKIGVRFDAADQRGYRIVFWVLVLLPAFIILRMLVTQARLSQSRLT